MLIFSYVQKWCQRDTSLGGRCSQIIRTKHSGPLPVECFLYLAPSADRRAALTFHTCPVMAEILKLEIDFVKRLIPKRETRYVQLYFIETLLLSYTSKKTKQNSSADSVCTLKLHLNLRSESSRFSLPSRACRLLNLLHERNDI